MSKGNIPFWRDFGLPDRPDSWSAPSVVRYAFQVVTTIIPVVLVGIPIIFFLWSSVWSTPPGLGGHFTLDGYRQLFTTPQVPETLYNTLVVVTVGTSLALLIGVSIAVLVTKTDIPGSKFISYVIIIQYMLPGMVLALSWGLVGGPNGTLNEILRLMGVIQDPVFNVYSEWGIALVMGINMSGLVFLLVSGAIGSVPRSMEESAKMSGANSYQVLKRITLSLSFPSIAIAAILVGALIAQSFGPPLVLGARTQTFVIATYMYLSINQFPPNFAVASSLGVILLVITVISLIVQRYLKGSNEGYQTIVGKGSAESMELSIGRKGRLISIALILLLAVTVILPLFIMVAASFQRAFVGFFSEHATWTTDNFRALLVGSLAPGFRGAVISTLFMAVVGSFLTMVLSSMISYVIVKTDSAISTFLDILMIAPLAVPTIILGIAYLWLALSYRVLGLYGSIWLIIIVIASRQIIYGTRATNSSLSSVGDNLEEAAQISGANIVTIMRKVYYPLIKPGFFAGYMLAFIHYFKAFTVPQLLKTGEFEVMSTLLWNYWSRGDTTLAATMATLMVIIIFLLYYAVQKTLDADLREMS